MRVLKRIPAEALDDVELGATIYEFRRIYKLLLKELRLGKTEGNMASVEMIHGTDILQFESLFDRWGPFQITQSDLVEQMEELYV